MKGWNTHQDQENRGYVHILRSLFPEQTKTLPRLIVWSIIFLIHLTVCIFGATYLGLLNSRLGQLLTLIIIFGGFWLLGKIWYKIVAVREKSKELG